MKGWGEKIGNHWSSKHSQPSLKTIDCYWTCSVRSLLGPLYFL